jgi:outer membrane murein-binding lipoprotein Lpp
MLKMIAVLLAGTMLVGCTATTSAKKATGSTRASIMTGIGY